MPIERIIIALLPVPLFYMIYYRHFSTKPELGKHLEAFLSGIAFAVFLLLISSQFDIYFNLKSSIAVGFINAALFEKLGAFFLIILIQRNYPNFSILESVMSSMLFGLGFSIVENISYADRFGQSMIIIRMLFSVPLHLTTCGIMGYYIGLSKLSSTKSYRLIFYAKSLAFSIFLHGTFDTILITGGYISYLSSPMLILLVLILEFLLAKANNILPLEILKAMNLRFEDWLLIDRQPRFERWILQSMGIPDLNPPRLIVWRPGAFRFIIVILFMVLAVIGLSFRPEIIAYLNINIKAEDEIIMLGAFPVSISIIMMMVGAVNPDFFKKSQIKIPIISDVDISQGDSIEEVMITYDISSVNCFIRSYENISQASEIKIKFTCSEITSPEIRATAVWENHTNHQDPIGSVLRIERPGYKFYLFLIKYYFFRIWKGFVFTLRLPGFESIRKFFMRPVSTMQDVRLLKAGTVIYHEGDEGKEFYLLKKGKVLFYKKKDLENIITLDVVDEGQIFGEMSMAGHSKRNMSAICADDCVIAVADRDNLNALIVNNPEFAKSLITTFANRIHLSEKILFENIMALEKQKKDNERIYHVAIMLILIGLGYNPENKNLSINIDLKKISDVVKNMDDAVAAEIINLIMMKRGNPELDQKISSAIDDMIREFNVRVEF